MSDCRCLYLQLKELSSLWETQLFVCDGGSKNFCRQKLVQEVCLMAGQIKRRNERPLLPILHAGVACMSCAPLTLRNKTVFLHPLSFDFRHKQQNDCDLISDSTDAIMWNSWAPLVFVLWIVYQIWSKIKIEIFC